MFGGITSARWSTAVLFALTVALPLAQARAAPEVSPDDALERAVRLADAARGQLLTEDRCPHSPAGVVLRIGSDPDALADFVRQRIRYEPCLGVVRGPQGTLAAGAGGDWDRAALLQALLAEAGFPSRLVVSSRSPAERGAVVDEFLAAQGRERTLGAAGVTSGLTLGPPAELLTELGVAIPNRQLTAASGAARWRRLLDESHDAAAVATPQLAEALAKFAGRAGQPFAEWREGLANAASDRVLVEVRTPTTVLLDLGPTTTPGASPPKTSGKKLTATPPDRLAVFRIALRMKVAGDDAPGKPIDLLDESIPLGELFGRPLRLQIAPDGSETGTEPPNEWSEEEWHEHVLAFERFQAVLQVDRLWIASDAFDVHGQTFKVKGDGRIEAAKSVGSAVGGLLGGMGASRPKEAAKPETRIEALTLELSIELPGRSPIRARRLIWGDLRRDVSPIYHTDLAVFPGPAGPDSLIWRTLDAVTANARFKARVFGSTERYRMLKTDGIHMLHQMLEDWQLARLGLADRQLALDPQLALLGGPAVVMKTTFILADGLSKNDTAKNDTAKNVRARGVIDVVHDGLTLVPRQESAVAGATRANLALGIGSTVLESVLMREKVPAAEIAGAYRELEIAAAQGRAPAVVRPGSPGSFVPDALASWALANEIEGRLIVFPSADDVAAWWSVDPATGVTVGRGGGGEGQSMAEYKAAIKVAFTNLKCMVALLSGMAKGKSGFDNSYDWAKCITGFDPLSANSYAGAIAKYEDTMYGLKAFAMFTDVIAGCENLMQFAQSQKEKKDAKKGK